MLTLDAKGRLTVPARYRDVLMDLAGGQLVVCKNPAGCLSLYPLSEWEAFEADLARLPMKDEGWRRLFIGSATDVEIDSASRVLIPPELREWANLKREVVFMGVGNKFELWDKGRQDEREHTLLTQAMPEALGARPPEAPSAPPQTPGTAPAAAQA